MTAPPPTSSSALEAPALESGRPWPLGASIDGSGDAAGVNFAVYSAHAEAIDLCLFDAAGEHELARLRLPARSGDVWHGRLRGVGAGCVYGLRAHGPWQPARGERFNAHKLLLDPYARDIVGDFRWCDAQFGHRRDAPDQLDPHDNAAVALKARVVDDAAWQLQPSNGAPARSTGTAPGVNINAGTERSASDRHHDEADAVDDAGRQRSGDAAPGGHAGATRPDTADAWRSGAVFAPADGDADATAVDAAARWAADRPPHTPLADSVIYELHVKAFSQRNRRLPAALRGSYAGLGHPESTAYLRRLGVTAVCLLPVHQRLDEERLVGMGLHNHWGYNTIGFFCVEPRLASRAAGVSPRDEFRAMVQALHAAGIEVLLDVVYNHTAESDEHGPTVSFRGLDNASYYRLDASAPARYENHAGCGNVLDIRQPAVRRLVLDSLRHWVADFHVDGFRFDLGPVLGRGDHGFERDGAFFTAIAQDPLLSRVKLIAEPWDIGPGGYQLGGFPRGWLEWNDQFRDTLRGFWLQPADAGAPGGSRGEFARRLCGSSDIFQHRRRQPAESVNYVVSHDGFTLRDLVSFQQRHNHANGEHNRDGHHHNLSTNCGVEGDSDDAAVNARRAALQRALLATLLLSQGTPMLAAGDEMGHSQRGNNNPYCQDNALTWIDWSQADADLTAYTARLIGLRRRLLPFANHWYSGRPSRLGLPDVAWLQPDGTPLVDGAWHDRSTRALACLIGAPGRARAPLLLLVNADGQPCRFTLPAGVWRGELDSAKSRGDSRWHGQGGAPIEVAAHAVVLLAAAGAG